jgi:hypothetical protein
MSELIQTFTGKTLPEWETWYLEQKPDAIRNATEKIIEMIKKLKEAMGKIDQAMIERWVKDLVLVKTFTGLKFQEAILKRGAALLETDYRWAVPEEEVRGIDGYIGKIPVSIKPHTYDMKAALPEKIEYKIIYYRKMDDAIEVDYGDLLG